MVISVAMDLTSSVGEVSAKCNVRHGQRFIVKYLPYLQRRVQCGFVLQYPRQADNRRTSSTYPDGKRGVSTGYLSNTIAPSLKFQIAGLPEVHWLVTTTAV